MFELLNLLAPWKLIGLLLRPFVRVLVGLIVAPLCRLFLRRVIRVKDLNEELERDITLWLRGSALLLIATRNMEGLFFKWVPVEWREEHVWILATRMLLAMSVIEAMPDQALFSIIHPGPPKPNLRLTHFWTDWKAYFPKLLHGLLCQHLNRSSPVLAILSVFLPGTVGWVCYGLAVTNYLIIGLVSSRDRAIDVLSQFDQAVAERRQELLEESPHADSVGA